MRIGAAERAFWAIALGVVVAGLIVVELIIPAISPDRGSSGVAVRDATVATAPAAQELVTPAETGVDVPGAQATDGLAGQTRPDASPTAAEATASPSATPSTEATEEATEDPAAGMPGLLTFRGDTSRTFYGTGPIPSQVDVAWRYPDRAMCASSTVGDETKEWCGTGWTGQPAVIEREGRTWVVFGGYDRNVHFVDGDTGEAILPPFPTGDIIKGSVTIDPDGYPIVWSGSRDGRYRAIAIDGDEPRELWALTAADATGPTRWNDDWDGAGLIVDDHLLIGGENSRFFLVRLNRGYDADGRVTLDPVVVTDVAGFDDELISALGDGNVSIETSVAYRDGIVWFANSGGLVQGWDLAPLMAGQTTEPPERIMRFWMGDDVDATIVIDDEGMLYVAAEWERSSARASEIGQIVKLDPSRPDDPLVWSVTDPAVAGQRTAVAGVWGTPAIHDDLLLVPTTTGPFLAIDRADGAIRWELSLGDHLWSSPVVVDDVLIQGDCAGQLHAFDLTTVGPQGPAPLWTLQIRGCVESTPAVWDGDLWVGTRAGQLVAVKPAPTTGGE